MHIGHHIHIYWYVRKVEHKHRSTAIINRHFYRKLYKQKMKHVQVCICIYICKKKTYRRENRIFKQTKTWLALWFWSAAKQKQHVTLHVNCTWFMVSSLKRLSCLERGWLSDCTDFPRNRFLLAVCWKNGTNRVSRLTDLWPLVSGLVQDNKATYRTFFSWRGCHIRNTPTHALNKHTYHHVDSNTLRTM